MKLYKKFLYLLLLSTGFLATSCVGDLDVTPIDPNLNTANKALKTQDDFRNFLAQCYTGFATSGSYGPNGDSNISGLDGGQSQYFRGMFHLNEYTTDECVVGWNDQTIQDLHGLAWTSSDTFVAALYYRIFYQIAMCNEFIRQAQASSLNFPEKATYIAEARALRALSYYHAIDMFGNVPFADETSPVGSTNPKRITRSDLFAWLETELKSLVSSESALKDARQNEYGRIDKGATRMILAKLYLNAEIYIGEKKYDQCAEVCKEIQKSGYSLHPKYAELFMADNNKCTDEIMFAIEQDGTYTQSFGVTNFLVFASCGGKMNPASMGISSGWGGIRVTPEFYDSFVSGDNRAMFFTTDQKKEIDNISNFQDGYAFMKFTNIRSDGKPASSKGFVDTDFGVFRYADALLMLAECAKRGATTVTEAEGAAALTLVRNRAGLSAVTTYTLDDILRERGCELYMEGWRRSDLIRFGKFVSNSYVWSWKGGVKAGKGVDAHFNLFPIPDKDLNSNSNLIQNEGYK